MSAGKMTCERVADAQREAGPDRRTEIERHPGNLALPFSDVVGDDPPNACVPEALQKAPRSDPFGSPGPPSGQIHRDVDGREKHQIACNPADRDDEGRTNQTLELREQPAKADTDDEEGNGPYGILDGVAQVVLGQHRMP